MLVLALMQNAVGKEFTRPPYQQHFLSLGIGHKKLWPGGLVDKHQTRHTISISTVMTKSSQSKNKKIHVLTYFRGRIN